MLLPPLLSLLLLLQTSFCSKKFRMLDAKVEEQQGYLRNAARNMSAAGQGNLTNTDTDTCKRPHLHQLARQRS
jgi:hypothetical protein